VHPVITPEEPVTDRNNVVEQAGGEEEEDHASEHSCDQSGMGVNGIRDSGC
jgi:hypothetical protein